MSNKIEISEEEFLEMIVCAQETTDGNRLVLLEDGSVAFVCPADDHHMQVIPISNDLLYLIQILEHFVKDHLIITDPGTSSVH